MSHKCNSCGNTSDEQKDCCGAPMEGVVAVSEETPVENDSTEESSVETPASDGGAMDESTEETPVEEASEEESTEEVSSEEATEEVASEDGEESKTE